MARESEFFYKEFKSKKKIFLKGLRGDGLCKYFFYKESK